MNKDSLRGCMGTRLHSLCLKETWAPLTLWSTGKAVVCRNPGLLHPCPPLCFSLQYFLIPSLLIPSLLSHHPPTSQLYDLLKLQENQHFHSFAVFSVALRKKGTPSKELMPSSLLQWPAMGWWQPSSNETLSRRCLSQESLLHTVKAFCSISCRRKSGLTLLIYTTRKRHS